MTHHWRRHPGLLVAMAVYLALAFSYFFLVPIFEAPDEWTHTGHVEFIAQGNGLPVMLPGQGIWGGQQPPLYYAIGAVLVQPFDLDGVMEYEAAARNPHASVGYALDPGNKNNYLHTPTESFPYQGLSLVVHLLRLYSMIFGLTAVIFTYLTAFELFNYQVPIANYQLSTKFLATAVTLMVATQPMFTFITASVTNETANIAFAAVALWLTQRYVLYGPTESWRRALVLGIILGLTSLSKMTGLSFGLVAAVAFLQIVVATRNVSGAAKLLWRDGIIIGTLFLVVSGWWYWRNYQLYGDVFQRGLYKLYFNQDPQPVSLSKFLFILSNSEISFWATFGWLNIVAPEWVYSIYRVISRVGLSGVGIAGAGRLFHGLTTQLGRRSSINHASPYALRPIVIHLVFPVALAFSLTRLVTLEGGLQGRQLLPALGSMAIVIVWGWWALTPRSLIRPVMIGMVGILLALALWLPVSLIRPAYVPKPFLTEADLPPQLNRIDLIYGDVMKLIGASIGPEIVQPGDRLPVTVYWQVLSPMETNYSVFVHLIGRNFENVGQLNTYPGLGLRPTTSLQPGQIIADTYPVLINGGSAAPTRLAVNVGLFDVDEPGRPGIPPTTLTGDPASTMVGQLKLVPNRWPALSETDPLADFDDNIRLMAYDLGDCQAAPDNCRLTLTWQARGEPAQDYTVFIQLWPDPRPDPPAATEPMFFGFDSPPLNNDYPTGLWAAGEVIIDPHALDLGTVPPGTYQILTGLYNPTDGMRLPARGQGEPLPNGAVPLEIIEVTASP